MGHRLGAPFLLRVRLSLQAKRLLQHDLVVLRDGDCRAGKRDVGNRCRPAAVWTAGLLGGGLSRFGSGNAEGQAPVFNVS